MTGKRSILTLLIGALLIFLVPPGMATMTPMEPPDHHSSALNPPRSPLATHSAGYTTAADNCGIFTSTDTPVAIPDDGIVTSTLSITSTLTISASYILTNVDITLNVSHTYVSELRVSLLAPDNTKVVILDQVDGGEYGFPGTTLDDDAGTPINTATPPLTGQYQPSSPLSAFTGKPVNGNWRLVIEDIAPQTSNTISGTLNGWQLTLCTGVAPSTESNIYLPTVVRDYTTGSGPINTDRLIVFEAFLSSYCGFCQNAAGIIDNQLVSEYAEQPVLFLEYNVLQNTPREARWWDGWAIGGTVGYPMTMVDSGNQVAERYVNGSDFYNLFKGMVDKALANPDGHAEIRATAVRAGDTVNFTVDMTNRGSITLGTGNKATIWAIIYEESDSGPVSDALTRRYVRAVASTALTSNLAPEAKDTYAVTIDTLSGVDWSKMNGVIIVDYKPNPGKRPYNTYQAIKVDIQ